MERLLARLQGVSLRPKKVNTVKMVKPKPQPVTIKCILGTELLPEVIYFNPQPFHKEIDFWAQTRKSTRKSINVDERSKSQDLMKEAENGVLSPRTAASPQSI